MFRTTLICTLLLSLSSPVLANEASHKKLAVQLVKIYEKDIDSSYNISNEADKIIKQDPAMKPYRNAMIKFMSKYLNNTQLKQYLVIAFMREFPEDRLKEIVRFLSSPAGKLWIEKSSQFDKTIQTIIRGIFSSHKGELIKLIEKG